MHRLGTIAAVARETTTAEQLLSQSQEHFSRRLGQDNPITGEVRAMRHSLEHPLNMSDNDICSVLSVLRFGAFLRKLLFQSSFRIMTRCTQSHESCQAASLPTNLRPL